MFNSLIFKCRNLTFFFRMLPGFGQCQRSQKRPYQVGYVFIHSRKNPFWRSATHQVHCNVHPMRQNKVWTWRSLFVASGIKLHLLEKVWISFGIFQEILEHEDIQSFQRLRTYHDIPWPRILCNKIEETQWSGNSFQTSRKIQKWRWYTLCTILSNDGRDW